MAFKDAGNTYSKEFANGLDAKDSLAHLREEFNIPVKGDMQGAKDTSNKESCIYLCGNSLGLQPKRLKVLVNEELDKWAKRGVVGHFDDSPRPWVSIDDEATSLMAKVVGAKTSEVAVMNSLTVNLHLLMVPFYRPTSQRFKILIESKAFPSDYLAVQSQIRFHGYDPADAFVEVPRREGEECFRDEDVLAAIEKHGDSLALVLLSGVQFYTGHLFDIEAITRLAHDKGCVVGFDLAHAVGNAELFLHDWSVDFACWCSYKYLNSGPGGIAGAFVHEKHAITDRPRFGGWWGFPLETRFKMEHEYRFIPGAQGYRLSNPPVLQVVSLLASLQVFDQTNMASLRCKSVQLTGYLEHLLDSHVPHKVFEIITPRDPTRRGCQLSLLFKDIDVKKLFELIEEKGVICDLREPDVIRVAPTPLYNTFLDCYNFVRLLNEAIETIAFK